MLIIAAKQDEVVPPKAAENLWKASGEQRKIIWYPCTHYGAVVFFFPAMTHVIKHLGAD